MACARGPFLREDAYSSQPQPLVTAPPLVQPYRAYLRLLLLHALKARFFASVGLPLGVRVAGQERLSGTAGRYGCQIRLSGTATLPTSAD